MQPSSSVTRLCILVVLTTTITACSFPELPLPKVFESKELVVITYNSSTTFYQDAEGKYAGLEYDLVKLFADELGLKVKFVVVPKFNQILPTLKNGKVHLAAAGLNITPQWASKVIFAPPYQKVKQKIVYHSDNPRPRSMKDLVGKKIEVVAGSDEAELLTKAKRDFPGLEWTEVATLGSFDLLRQLADGVTDYVVADAHVVDIARNLYPELATGFDLGHDHSIAWAFPKNADPELLKHATQFFARIAANGTLKRILDRYYGHIKRLDQTDVSSFLEKIQTVLPRYRRYFYEAQDITGIDWRLLAGLSFHESHWDPLATSYTGVRGIMMLTSETADRMNVSDRLDPKQSILAGARYLSILKDTIPVRIPEPDKTWLAISAYNVGYGHLEDARILAQRQRLDPDSWTDIKKTLPLLSKVDYFTTLKHGFARGGEPVIMTENIRTYYDILAKYEKPYRPMLVPEESNITITKRVP